MANTLVTASIGAFLLFTGTASAQSAAWLSAPAAAYSADDRVSFLDARRAAYDNGYRDGLKRGEQAARDRRQLDVERERDYRDADNGYNRSFGDRRTYANNYRGGFTQGYRDAYARLSRGNNGGWNNGRNNGGGWNNGGWNGGYGSAGYGAYQNGAADGYRKGLEDIDDREYPDARRHKWYRSGDHDYDERYGSKEAYRVEYRRGFQEGYDRAYRDGRRY